MAKFLVTYYGAAAGVPDRGVLRSWCTDAGAAILDPGARLRTLTQLASNEPQPRSTLDGYVLIEAASLESAADLLRSHPVLDAGGTLQINEVLDG